jgi:hypothetical protein
MEDNYPFYPIWWGYCLEILRILSGKVIPETDRINFREAETGGGFYR